MKYNENSDLFYDKYKPVYNHLENKDYYQFVQMAIEEEKEWNV